MDRAIKFIREYIKADYQAEVSSRDLINQTYDDYLEAMKLLENYLYIVHPGVNYRDRDADNVNDEVKARKLEGANTKKPRILFKITQFRSSIYEELFVAYTSSMNNPSSG